MSILNFPRNVRAEPGRWRPLELRHLQKALAVHVTRGVAGGWAYGETERGDPQLYLLSPDAEPICLLSISRLDEIYVMEDGDGHIVFEHTSLVPFAQRVAAMLRYARPVLLVPMAGGWAAMSGLCEFRTELATLEYVEALARLAFGTSGIG